MFLTQFFKIEAFTKTSVNVQHIALASSLRKSLIFALHRKKTQSWLFSLFECSQKIFVRVTLQKRISKIFFSDFRSCFSNYNFSWNLSVETNRICVAIKRDIQLWDTRLLLRCLCFSIFLIWKSSWTFSFLDCFRNFKLHHSGANVTEDLFFCTVEFKGFDRTFLLRCGNKIQKFVKDFERKKLQVRELLALSFISWFLQSYILETRTEMR